MGLLKDWRSLNGGTRLRYKIVPFFSPKEWLKLRKWQKQRQNRGWSDRDTWGGGEHLMEVAMGILYKLDEENNPIDWDAYFENNYPNNYGYESLSEVAQALDNYLFWQEEQWEDKYDDIDHETRWALESALYEESINAMHFVAANIGGLWW